jgi:hypothetical protein
MPERFYKYCREGGCHERTNDRSGFCESHRQQNAVKTEARIREYARKKDDPSQKIYHGKQWERFKLAFRAAGNVICARIEDGKKCQRPSDIIHHLRGVRSHPHLAFTFENCRPTCRQHHPPSDGSPPEDDCNWAPVSLPNIQF